jgi:hypothetical protein
MTISQNLKTIVPSLGLSKTALVLINQTRIKIGVMYGNPETTPGGVALRFYSSVRMRVAKKGTLGSRGNEHDPNDIKIVAIPKWVYSYDYHETGARANELDLLCDELLMRAPWRNALTAGAVTAGALASSEPCSTEARTMPRWTCSR